jgi:hypothetical protein
MRKKSFLSDAPPKAGKFRFGWPIRFMVVPTRKLLVKIENQYRGRLGWSSSWFHASDVLIVLCLLSGCISRDTVAVTNFTRASSSVVEPNAGAIHQSRCFWLGNGDSQELLWDTNVSGTYKGNPAVFSTGDPPVQNGSQLDACYEGPLRINGDNAVVPPWTQLVRASLLECQRTQFDVLGTCVPLEANANCPSLVDQGCMGGTADRNFPYCSTGCTFSFGANDAILEVKSDAVTQAIPLVPTFYPVVFSRMMVRQMDPCTIDDPQAGTLKCSWQEPTGSDGLWDENFKPDLFVAHVRAFVAPNGDPAATNQRRYLKLSYIEIGVPPNNFRCHTGSDETQVGVDDCVHLGDATPAYLSASLNTSVPWLVSTPDAVHGGDTSLTPGARAFIEFQVASPRMTGPVPFVSPSFYDFGVVPAGQNRSERRAVFLNMGDSPVGWDLRSTTTSGTNPSDFEIHLEGNSTILPGGIRGIDAIFHPTSTGLRSAIANLTLADTQGHSVMLSINFSGWSGPQPLSLIPDHLVFQNERERTPPFAPLPLPWRKQFLLQNAWPGSIDRTNVTLSGAGASAFSIVEVDQGDKPIPPSHTLPTAASELFAVIFCPVRSGNYSAVITIGANEGSPNSPVSSVGSVTLTAVAPSSGIHEGPLCTRPIPVPR